MTLDVPIKRIFISLVLLMLTISLPLNAQGKGSLRGTVYDKETNETLPGANVLVKGTTLGAACNLDGEYVIRNIPAGRHTIIVSYIGYEPDSAVVDIPVGKTLAQDFYLEITAIEGQDIIITAQAQGQLEAINQQLTSDKIANIVSESRIQELPDFNAAAALSRLPGISTQKSSGEDSKVVIRGLSPKYNSIEVEGVKLSATGSSSIGITSDPYVATGGLNNDRSVDLTMISPYMIRMIAVYKSLTPDMNANSIGGTVNMELREAPSGLHWNLLYQQGYTAKSKTFGNFRAVASASNRFFNDKLGVYALVNAESYDRNADNMDAGYALAAEEVQIDPTTGYRPVKVTSVTFNRHIETRKRFGANLIMDYNLPSGSIKFVNMFARLNSDYTDNRQTINYDNGRMEWQLRLGDNTVDQRMHSIKLDYDLGFMTADLSANYTSANNVLDRAPVINFNQTDALQSGVKRDNVKPEDLTYLLTKFRGSDEVILRSANLFSNNYLEEKFSYKADFEIPFGIGNTLSGFFKFGGQIYNQYNRTDQEAPYLGFNGNANSTDNDIQSNLMRTIKEQFGISTNDRGELVGTSFINNDNELYDPFLDNKYGSVYYVANPSVLTQILDYIIGNPQFDASNKQYSTGAQGGWYDGPFQQLTNDYRYNEDYYASYGMFKVNFWKFMVIAGARYEKVKTEYFAYNARDMRNAQAQIMYDTTDHKSNEFVLPMGQVKFSPTKWLDIRYAYTQTLSRPDYHLISPKFTITQNNAIYTGNPELKPAQAFNHDLSFTFHTNEIGLLSIGAFYKTIENFVYNASYQLDAAEGAGIDSLPRYQIVRDGALVVTPVVNPTTGKSNAMVYRPLNNPYDATVKGLEFDFQHNFWYLPSPFNNMVLGINYARIASETRYPFYDVKVKVEGRQRIPVLVDSSAAGRLLDQPNHVLNAYLGYDYKDFSIRLSFVYQDQIATGNGGRYPENDSYSDDYFRVDLSARQKLPFLNSELFLDFSNLNNANTQSLHKSTGGFRNIQNYGLTANLGIRLRY
ncbi:MAG: carboxypeptidase-like regulatory domain-containing protein [Melioribacter sp.]|uniref:TonB-dependent receptor n=1 Tax=Melioribacter sp. TaxID=2052167 RepID=UPI003BEBD022